MKEEYMTKDEFELFKDRLKDVFNHEKMLFKDAFSALNKMERYMQTNEKNIRSLYERQKELDVRMEEIELGLGF